MVAARRLGHRVQSATTSSKSSISTRSPAERPWPMWSGPYTTAPCRDERVRDVLVAAEVLAVPVHEEGRRNAGSPSEPRSGR